MQTQKEKKRKQETKKEFKRLESIINRKEKQNNEIYKIWLKGLEDKKQKLEAMRLIKKINNISKGDQSLLEKIKNIGEYINISNKNSVKKLLALSFLIKSLEKTPNKEEFLLHQESFLSDKVIEHIKSLTELIDKVEPQLINESIILFNNLLSNSSISGEWFNKESKEYIIPKLGETINYFNKSVKDEGILFLRWLMVNPNISKDWFDKKSKDYIIPYLIEFANEFLNNEKEDNMLYISNNVYVLETIEAINAKKMRLIAKVFKALNEISNKNTASKFFSITFQNLKLNDVVDKLEGLDLIIELFIQQNEKNSKLEQPIKSFLKKSLIEIIRSDSSVLYTNIINILKEPLEVKQKTPSEIAKAMLKKMLDDEFYAFFSKKHELGKAKNWNKGYKLRRLNRILAIKTEDLKDVSPLFSLLNDKDKRLFILILGSLTNRYDIKNFILYIKKIYNSCTKRNSKQIIKKLLLKYLGNKGKTLFDIITILIEKNPDLGEKVLVWLPSLIESNKGEKLLDIFNKLLSSYLKSKEYYKKLRYKNFPKDKKFWEQNISQNIAKDNDTKEIRTEIIYTKALINNLINKYKIQELNEILNELNFILKLINKRKVIEIKKHIGSIKAKIKRKAILKDINEKDLINKRLDRIELLLNKYFIKNKPLTFVFTDDFELLFNMGKSRYIDTCQSYDWPGEEKLGLLGAIANPWVKMFAILDGKEIVGRVKTYFVKKVENNKEKYGVIIGSYYGSQWVKDILFKKINELVDYWLKNRYIDYHSFKDLIDDVSPVGNINAPIYIDSQETKIKNIERIYL